MRNNASTQLLRGTSSMRERTSQEVHICDSDERWLIINRNEQLDTTKINPAVRSGVAWHQVARELGPRLHKDQIAPPPSQLLRTRLSDKISLLIRQEDWGTTHRMIFPSSDLIDVLVVKVVGSMMATPHDPTSQCPDSTGVAWKWMGEIRVYVSLQLRYSTCNI